MHETPLVRHLKESHWQGLIHSFSLFDAWFAVRWATGDGVALNLHEFRTESSNEEAFTSGVKAR